MAKVLACGHVAGARRTFNSLSVPVPLIGHIRILNAGGRKIGQYSLQSYITRDNTGGRVSRRTGAQRHAAAQLLLTNHREGVECAFRC